jgi:hypothetical protein
MVSFNVRFVSLKRNYERVLSSERAPYRKNNKAIVSKEKIRIKSGQGPQRGARYQDELVD